MATKVELFTAEERGRGYRAVVQIGTGELVLKEKPFAYVLCNTERGERCDFCFHSRTTLLRCSGCKFARYCNVKCQRSAWLDHKAECASLKITAPKVPTDSTRLVARIIYKLRDRTRDEDTKKEVEDFLSLQSHLEEMEKRDDRKQQFTQMMFILKKCMDEDVLAEITPELFAIFGRMVSNCFSICDGDMRGSGVGIYNGVALLNHSCDPNCVAVFRGTDIYIRSIKKINPGEEITICYIEVFTTTARRRRELKEMYYFDCTCEVCENLEKDRLKRSARCSTPNCSEPVLPDDEGGLLPCKSCEKQSSKTHATKYCEAMKSILENMTKIQDAKKQIPHDKWILELCEKCLKVEGEFLHNYNIHMVQMMDRAMDACVAMKKWEGALKFGLMAIEPCRLHHPTHHPHLGIILMKIGKLQVFLTDVKLGEKSLQQAFETLNITHGPSHPLTKDLEGLLTQCQEELRVQAVRNMMQEIEELNKEYAAGEGKGQGFLDK
ncbi:histone-lysine N-methyltransferase SMYD3-like [Glandiceps talaboti]